MNGERYEEKDKRMALMFITKLSTNYSFEHSNTDLQICPTCKVIKRSYGID